MGNNDGSKTKTTTTQRVAIPHGIADCRIPHATRFLSTLHRFQNVSKKQRIAAAHGETRVQRKNGGVQWMLQAIVFKYCCLLVFFLFFNGMALKFSYNLKLQISYKVLTLGDHVVDDSRFEGHRRRFLVHGRCLQKIVLKIIS